MRSRAITSFALLLLVISTIVVAILTGCGEEAPEEVTGSTAIDIESLIVQPAAPAPGDTVDLTATVVSSSLNVGDFPAYSWQADGGTFLETDKAYVRWVAPDSSRIFTVTVTASNSVSTTSKSVQVFVTDVIELVAAEGAEIRRIPQVDSFYFLRSPYSVTAPAFEGFTIHSYSSGTTSPVTSANPGIQYDFSNDLSFAVHAVIEEIALYEEDPINIFLDELPSGVQTQLTHDGAHSVNRRRYQFTYPVISPDNKLVAFQSFRPALLPPAMGGVDTFDVYVYDVASSQVERITTRGRNFHPSFSSDGLYLTFLSDRDTLSGGWEIFAYPVAGGVVDTSEAALVQLSHTGGLVSSSSPPERPIWEWNPDPGHPFLALVDANSKLRLIGTDGTSDPVSSISGKVASISWSSDGTKLAASTGANIYLVGLDRTAQLLHSSQEGDKIDDIAWIDEDRMLLYNIERAGNTWFEAYNVSEPGVPVELINVTKRHRKGAIEKYRELVDLRPSWRSNDDILLLVFKGATPAVMRLDISGMFD